MDGPETGKGCLGREAGPATVGFVDREVHDGQPAPVGVDTRPFVGLSLEELKDAHPLAGRCKHSQPAIGGRQHQPGGGDVNDCDAPLGQEGEEIDDVEVLDQAVGELHHRLGEQCFSRHVRSPVAPCLEARPTVKRFGLLGLFGEAQAAGHHVGRHGVDGASGGEGVSPEADQRLTDAHLQLR